MHNNLSSHKSDEIYHAIYSHGHRVICRVPYRPHEGPIEWVFDQLGCEIRKRWHVIRNEVDLIRETHKIINSRAGFGGFDGVFLSCGYVWE